MTSLPDGTAGLYKIWLGILQVLVASASIGIFGLYVEVKEMKVGILALERSVIDRRVVVDERLRRIENMLDKR